MGRVPILLAVASIAALGVVFFVGSHAPSAPAGTVLPVQVVDSATGHPLRAARLTPPRLGGNPAVVRVTAPGYEGRTVALAPRQEAAVPLVRRASARPPRAPLRARRRLVRRTISLEFGGDVMMGRRYYEPVDGRPPLLPRGAGVADHVRLLGEIAPLLRDSDLTVVNLEGPLLDNPIVPPDRAGFNRGKDLVFASSTALAGALRQSGVDVAGLANNHLYDALGRGVRSTLSALDRAGIAHFGAGFDEEQAWQPAYVRVGGRTVAFIGCTTLTGYGSDPSADLGDASAGGRSDTSYVAGPHKAGAAKCETSRLADTIAEARQRSDVVAVVLHGGVEYQRTQSARIRDLAAVAAHAGATVVVGGHPHVVGGVTTFGSVPWVESTGNLTFDQNLWDPSFSYLARVDTIGGSVVRTSVAPFVVDRYRPVPVVGPVADAVGRIATGTVRGPLALGYGAAAAPRTPVATHNVGISSQGNSVVGLPVGAVLPTGSAGGGSDLLFGTGTFERFTTGTEPAGAMWNLGHSGTPSHLAACDGSYGIEMLRSPVTHENIVITPDYRQPVTAGERLSLVAMVHAADPGATLELHWYKSLTGASAGERTLAIPPEPSTGGCHQVRLDVTAPPGTVAVEPFVRLLPAANAEERTRLWIDDIRLVAWDVPDDRPVLADAVDQGKVKSPLTLTRLPVR